MIVQDDRTPAQKKTHVWAIVGSDRFMSGWGGARGGKSRVAWAFSNNQPEHKILRWVKSRGDIQYVNMVNLKTYRPPAGTAHFHIYVVTPGHPALN